jgi:hypothetical protein
LTPEQIEVAVEFIKKNDGTTVNKLVEYMKDRKLCSKMTSLKIASHLERTGRIEDHKIGNGFHQLHFNERNEFNLIARELRDIEFIVNRMEVIHQRVQQNSGKIHSKLLTIRGPFSELVFLYQESVHIMLRSLLVKTHDSVRPIKNSQTLYTKITELLLKVTKQQFPSHILNDANVLKNTGEGLSVLKGTWNRFHKIDSHEILDTKLLNGLIKKIDNFAKDLT